MYNVIYFFPVMVTFRYVRCARVKMWTQALAGPVSGGEDVIVEGCRGVSRGQVEYNGRTGYAFARAHACAIGHLGFPGQSAKDSSRSSSCAWFLRKSFKSRRRRNGASG